MKLVDILARELKAWPEGVDSVWQSSCDNEIYFDADVPPFYTSLNAEDSGTKGAVITQAQWQAAVDALNADKCEHSYANNIGCPECGELNAPKVVEWDGEGLPPVGSTCEHSTDDNKNDSADGGWKKVKIVGHHQFHNDDYLCAVWVSGTDVSYSSEGEHFRPIRTAEQVAAEEIEAIREFLIYEHCDGGLIGIAKALHESGYRKEPKPCGS